MVMDLVVRKGMKDKRLVFMRCSCKVVLHSLVNPNLHMPYRIETMVYDLVEPVSIQLHTNHGFLEVVQCSCK